MARLGITALQKLRDDGTRIAVLTCYERRQLPRRGAQFLAGTRAAGPPEFLLEDLRASGVLLRRVIAVKPIPTRQPSRSG